jgi:hypothetical protein
MSEIASIKRRLDAIERHLGIYHMEIVQIEEVEGTWLHYCTKSEAWEYIKDELLCCVYCGVKKDG